MIGAVIEGADLREPNDALCAALKQVLLRWKVLFFCDNQLTAAQQAKLGRQFGELEINPVVPHVPGVPEVSIFVYDRESRGDQNMWHSDVSWRAEPSWGSILYDGYTSIRAAPFMVIFGGLPLVLATLGFTFLGEGLRDYLDPRLKLRRPA